MSKEDDKAFQNWSYETAEVIADAMIDAKLITKEQFDEAIQVIGVEIFVQFICGNFPPPLKPKLLKEKET